MSSKTDRKDEVKIGSDSGMSFRKLTKTQAKVIISEYKTGKNKDLVSNKNLNFANFEKYLRSGSKNYRWIGGFDSEDNCVALVVLTDIPSKDIVLLAEIQSFISGKDYGRKILEEVLKSHKDIWLACDVLGGESLLRFYRSIPGLKERKIDSSIFTNDGSGQSFFYKSSSSENEKKITDQIEGFRKVENKEEKVNESKNDVEKINDSILDTPKLGLDEFVWQKNGDGTYSLKDGPRDLIKVVYDWFKSKFGISRAGLHITGSITSNSYSSESDIDLHFNSDEIEQVDAEQFNKDLRKQFDVLKKNHPEISKLGTHPIELYFQKNPYQDLMSVGCYDFVTGEWLVGPELKDSEFDPYSEYYDEDMDLVDEVIDEIRNIIFEIYELCVVTRKSKDLDFQSRSYSTLVGKLHEAKSIFLKAKETRKAYSDPVSREDALEKRSSRKWKVADSAFKLLDKFGYLSILKQCQMCSEDIENGKTKDSVIDDILSVILLNFQKNCDIIHDSMQNVGESVDVSRECLEESAVHNTILAVIAGILFPLSNAEARTFEKNVSSVPKTEMKVTNQKVQDAIRNTVKSNYDFGGLNRAQLTNMLARTIYMEASNQYRKHGRKSLEAIAEVLKNRAGNNPSNYVKVVSAKSQWSSWRKYSGTFDKNFVITVPSDVAKNHSNKTVKEIWRICNEIADKMADKKFTANNIGNRNMIGSDKDNQTAKNTWHKLEDGVKIGDHTFYYAKD